jgi:hypothetical protein
MTKDIRSIVVAQLYKSPRRLIRGSGGWIWGSGVSFSRSSSCGPGRGGGWKFKSDIFAVAPEQRMGAVLLFDDGRYKSKSTAKLRQNHCEPRLQPDNKASETRGSPEAPLPRAASSSRASAVRLILTFLTRVVMPETLCYSKKISTSKTASIELRRSFPGLIRHMEII